MFLKYIWLKYFFCVLLSCVTAVCSAQEKEKMYLLFNDNYQKTVKKDPKGCTAEISFWLGKSWSAANFVYKTQEHSLDTLTAAQLSKLRIVSLSELRTKELEKYKSLAGQLEVETGFKLLPPIDHEYFDVYVLEKLSDGKLLSYQINWIATVI
ncbi:hypothetical protein D770_10260 [Flammeovirgaceae bacterium 311]|nr:hypothetical protein D770_10260 [Flammeovirgaceae bacterium 311]